MLQSKLRTALSSLFTNRGGAIVSLPEKLLLLNRIESLRRPLHSCAKEEDDFAELGSPVGKDPVAFRKLLTEKPEKFKKTARFRKASSAAESSKRLRNTFLKSSDCASAPQSKAANSTGISKSNIVKRTAYNFESSNSVTIENVPSIIQLPVLEEVMLDFGKISNILMRTVPNGLDCCDVEFESAESRSRALSVGRIDVMNFNLPIHPLCPPDVVAVRICNISPETADSAIHSLCMSFGPLEGIVRKVEDAVVAFFAVKKNSDSGYILEKLNNTIMDKHNWSAHLLTSDSTAAGVTSDDNSLLDLGLKVNAQIEDLKQKIALVKIDIEDLELLHHSIMHIQNHPLTGTGPSHQFLVAIRTKLRDCNVEGLYPQQKVEDDTIRLAWSPNKNN